MTETLIAFVKARLDDDEAIAQAAAVAVTLGRVEEYAPDWHRPIPDAPWLDDDERDVASVENNVAMVVFDEGSPTPRQAEHIARHDPARVLREVEAKRQILAETLTLIESEWGGAGYTSPWGLELLRSLALPYINHPDYDETWKPKPAA